MQTATCNADFEDSVNISYSAGVQIQGKDRLAVAEAGNKLGLDGTYIARSYIEQVKPLS